MDYGGESRERQGGDFVYGGDDTLQTTSEGPLIVPEEAGTDLAPYGEISGAADSQTTTIHESVAELRARIADHLDALGDNETANEVRTEPIKYDDRALRMLETQLPTVRNDIPGEGAQAVFDQQSRNDDSRSSGFST